MLVKWKNEAPWYLTTVYGRPQKVTCHALWEGLKDIGNVINAPWCVIGDFNDFLKISEKESGCAGSHSGPCKHFQSCLIDCGLEDMGFNGAPFTWHRGGLNERLEIG